MPSIFSRSRTASTPTPSGGPAGEFGALTSPIRSSTALSSKKKKDKKDKGVGDEAQKQFAAGVYGSYYNASSAGPDPDVLPPLPDGSFLPTTIIPVTRQSLYGTPAPNPLLVADSKKEISYGFLSYRAHIVLSPASLLRAVTVLYEELVQRGGLTTPFIFNSSHLELSGVGKGLSRLKRCIDTFTETLRFEPTAGKSESERERSLREKAENDWRDELRITGMQELGVLLRWTLARPVRISHRAGGEVRGLIDWDRYDAWRNREASAHFPPAHFPSLLSPPTGGLPQGAALAPNTYPPLDKDLQRTILTVLSLLTRMIANSASSGHTPPSLAALFGPLFFGLGPNIDTFPTSYTAYLRSAHATEHLILSFVRWQDSPAAPMTPGSSIEAGSGSARSLGVPTRLKEWIKNYPQGLEVFGPDRDKAMTKPRRGVRTVRVISVRRNSRMYTADLVKNASTWATYRDPATSTSSSKKGGISMPNAIAPGGQGEGSTFSRSREWSRISPSTRGSNPLPSDRLPPKYSEAYKRRMALGRNTEPATGVPGAASTSNLSLTPSLASSVSSTDSTSSYFAGSPLSRTGSSLTASEDTSGEFESLADLKWGAFESFGFGSSDDTSKKLEFDLTESARQARSKKRETLNWSDFTSDGFSRGDIDLHSTLGFSKPLATTISSWPQQREEMQRKLKKAQKALPPFGWSTEPVLGTEEIIEEAFIDVFCDLIYGGGWADRERERGGEESWLEQECNWALIEFRAEPPTKSSTAAGVDPRNSTSVLLFEEFVPLEYRQQLSHHATSTKRPRLQSLFTTKESQNSKWKQAATLNGKPYVLGATPNPSRGQTAMKREMEFEALLKEDKNGVKIMSLSDLTASNAPHPTPKKEKSGRFKLGALEKDKSEKEPTKPEPLPKLAVPAGMDRKSLVPAEYSSVDFETRLAGYSDSDEENEAKQQRRKKNLGGKDEMDDAWVDILVGSQSRRIGGQDALAPGKKQQDDDYDDDDGLAYDTPDQASADVAQALAGVRSAATLSDDDTVGRRHYDEDVDEIERVPRTRDEHVHEDYASTRFSDMYTDGGDPDDFPPEDEDDEDLRRSREVRARAQEALSRARLGGGYFNQHPDRARPSSISSTSTTDTMSDADTEEMYGRQSLDSGERTPVATEPPSRIPLPSSQSSSNGLPASPKPVSGNSKTAALIEMYREKEKGGAASSPSRLPVRGSSLEAPAGPRGPRSPSSPSAPAPPSASAEPDPPQPTAVTPPERETPSPARYIHGAPLHNVVEEEE
ncbi:hypothetical protein DL96DRAFT_1597474, partial [Flagelloscypha sp. PMI_526]